MKHLEAKEPHIFLSSWWRPKTEQKKQTNNRNRVNIGFTVAEWLQMNVNVNTLALSALSGDQALPPEARKSVIPGLNNIVERA